MGWVGGQGGGGQEGGVAWWCDMTASAQPCLEDASCTTGRYSILECCLLRAKAHLTWPMPDTFMHHTKLASPELTCIKKLDHVQSQAIALGCL